jgi:isopentenyl phosphate kinase
MSELIFVKLGGSVITDKMRAETPRQEVITRLAEEVARGLAARPGIKLVLGHGSGSFGHTVARRYGTRQGVYSVADWQGFAQVAATAARLNRLVTDLFLAGGVPVWSLPPSASAQCEAGALIALATAPMEEALARGLVPLVYGDVALDRVQGGTIVSTEQVFAYLARRLFPRRMILVGIVDGVFEGDPIQDPSARPITEVTAANWDQVRAVLGDSHATDVTGGMQAKVEAMVELVREIPGFTVHLISGERSGSLESALVEPGVAVGGTLIH